MILAGLYRRRADNNRPFTIVSCDNILHNGDVARSVVIGLATLLEDSIMVQWIRRNVMFPNGDFFRKPF
jgi:mannitol-1-phosphate/altronate dehydrogenase